MEFTFLCSLKYFTQLLLISFYNTTTFDCIILVATLPPTLWCPPLPCSVFHSHFFLEICLYQETAQFQFPLFLCSYYSTASEH